MALLLGTEQVIPRVRRVSTDNVIQAVAGANPVDSSPVSLVNTRGQLTITGTSADNSFQWVFEVQGSLGGFTNLYRNNWFFTPNTNTNCTVNQTVPNILEVVTPAGDAGGRIYQFVFSPITSVAPTIRQTSVNVLTDDLSVRVEYYSMVPGFVNS